MWLDVLVRFLRVLVVWFYSFMVAGFFAGATTAAQDTVADPSLTTPPRVAEGEESARIRREVLELQAQGDAVEYGRQPLAQAIRALDSALQRERNQDLVGADRARRIAEAALVYARHKIARERSAAALASARERRSLMRLRLERARGSSP